MQLSFNTPKFASYPSIHKGRIHVHSPGKPKFIPCAYHMGASSIIQYHSIRALKSLTCCITPNSSEKFSITQGHYTDDNLPMAIPWRLDAGLSRNCRARRLRYTYNINLAGEVSNNETKYHEKRKLDQRTWLRRGLAFRPCCCGCYPGSLNFSSAWNTLASAVETAST